MQRAFFTLIRRLSARVCLISDYATTRWVYSRSRAYFRIEELRACPNNRIWKIIAGAEFASTIGAYEIYERRDESGEYSRFLVSAQARIVVVDLPQGSWRSLYALRMIRNALRWELVKEAPLFLHGVCVAQNDKGVCLIGSPRSGKSTLGLLLLQQRGWWFTTEDDICVVRSSKGGWQLLGWPGCIRLRRSGISIFPKLLQFQQTFSHPANSLARNLSANEGLLRVFPEELEQLMDFRIQADCTPDVVIHLRDDIPDDAFSELSKEDLYVSLLDSWDILPERRPARKPEQILRSGGRWDEMVFDPFFLNVYGFPDFASLKSLLEQLCRDIRGFVCGRKAPQQSPFRQLLRSHLLRK
jgi:hypothetical protein